jgi:polysaccharide export outer membrane protein
MKNLVFSRVAASLRRIASSALRFAAAALVGAALAACNPSGFGADVVAPLPEPDSIKAGASFATTEYRIAPQDVLEITIYRFEALSRTVQVDGTGRVSLPLIGAIIAGGKTVAAFEAELTRRFGERYLQSPQISVLVKESVGARVTVDGAVKSPGVYSLKGRTTLLQALALAGGINEVGDTTVTLTRIADQRHVSAQVDVAAIRTGQATDPLIYGGDTIVVDESAGRTGLQVLKNTVPAVIGLGVRAVP